MAIKSPGARIEKIPYLKTKNTQGNQGFTLIEIAIALAVLGILLVPILATFDMEVKQQQIKDSRDRPYVLQSALERYVAANGHYPAPATPGTPSTASNYGRSVTTPVASIPTCRLNTPGVCKAPGARDPNQFVLIGDFPFSTLGVPENFNVDGYGNKFTYAITEKMLAKGFSDADGEISIIDQRGNTYKYYDNSPLNDPPNKEDPGTVDNALDTMAHYVIISHGYDGNGGFTREGRLSRTCAMHLTKDYENCDGDSTFNSNNNFVVKGTDSNGVQLPTEYDRIESRGDNNDYYDDYILFSSTVGGYIWALSIAKADLFNLNTGNIRIGSSVADYDGDGNNDLIPEKGRIEVWGNVKTDIVYANRICSTSDINSCPTLASLLTSGNPTQAGVFSPAIFASVPDTPPANTCDTINVGECSGYGIRCIGGTGMTGIENADELCRIKKFPVDPAYPGNSMYPFVNNGGALESSCNTAGNYFGSRINAMGQMECRRW